MQTNLFEQVCSFENIYLAYKKAKRNKKYRPYVLEFSANLERNIISLANDLKTGRYCHGKYKERYISDLKKRLIKIAPFRDRIVHHAICNIIEPIFDKNFVKESFACRIGKGNHRAVLKFKSMIRVFENSYCLKCDISKYFASIKHNILLDLIKKKIKDERLVNLIMKVIYSSHDSKMDYLGKESIYAGIPIGNLTSQLFANIYLNELDHFIKEVLKEKQYIRYMDDFLIISPNKVILEKDKLIISKFLKRKLGLTLHPRKANVILLNQGVEFLGYKFFKNYRLIRKATIGRFEKTLKAHKIKLGRGEIDSGFYLNSLSSWGTFARFANSYKLRQYLFMKYSLPIEAHFLIWPKNNFFRG